jgi:GT2 family glycosyltransferase
MRTALIILNYNSNLLTKKLVDFLHENVDFALFSIFLIDNNSKSDITEIETYCRAKNANCIEEKNLDYVDSIDNLYFIKLNSNYGYGKGNNFGLKLAFRLGFDFAYIMNPDVEIVDIGILKNLVDKLNLNKKIGIIAPIVILPDGLQQGPFQRISWKQSFMNLLFPLSIIFDKLFKYLEHRIAGYNRVFSVVGCFFALNLKIWDKINYFDETTFLYCEEYIISERLKTNGYITTLNKNNYIIHNHTYNFDFAQNPHFQQSFKYYLSNYRKPSKILYLFSRISSRYLLLLKGIWKFNPNNSLDLN